MIGDIKTLVLYDGVKKRESPIVMSNDIGVVIPPSMNMGEWPAAVAQVLSQVRGDDGL